MTNDIIILLQALEVARDEARRHEAVFVASLVSGAGDQDAA